MDFIYELLGELVSEVLVPALLLVAVVILAMPIYFILKKLSGRKTTFREDVWEAFFTPAAMRPPSPLVQELDSVRSGLETVGVYLLYSAIALVTGFIFYFFVKLPHDPNRAFLEVFFGVGYLVFMLFAVGQVFALKSRRRAHGANRRAVTTEFSFQFGAPPAGGSGPQVRMEFSVPELEDKVDDAALDKAESYLAIGEPPHRDASEIYKPAPASTILGLTRVQLIVAGVVFVTAFAAFLSIMIVLSRAGK